MFLSNISIWGLGMNASAKQQDREDIQIEAEVAEALRLYRAMTDEQKVEFTRLAASQSQ